MNGPSAGSAAREVDTATILTYGLVGAIVAAYIAARAIFVPLTYDEAATFFRYIDEEAGAVFDFSVATNHFLNTVATWLSYQLFGGAPWALRLPNVIAGLAFLAGAAAIARHARNPAIGFAGFVLLVTNPYLLDYLALSRGYGLALGLLTGSVYYLLRWRELPRDAPGTGAALRRALSLAAAAVVATLTVLPAFLALVGVVVLRLAWTRRTIPPPEVVPSWRVAFPWKPAAAWTLIAGAFSLLVFAHHPVLAQELFLPIAVRAAGLGDDETRHVQVWRLDASGRRRALASHAAGEWKTGEVKEAWGLIIDLPAQTDSNLSSLDVTIGSAVYHRDRHAAGPWVAEDVGGRRVLHGAGPLVAEAPGTGASERAINWAGDDQLWRLALARTAGVMAAFAALAAALIGILGAASRAGWMSVADARLVGSAVLAVGAFCAAPLYLLRRDAQLYFGGSTGLISDTFGSLIYRSAYGVSYAVHQTDAVLASLAAGGAAVVGLMLWRREGRRMLAAPATIVALVAIIAIEVSVQHAVLGTPWLTGRTALFLLPLLSIFVLLTADGLAAAVPRIRFPVASAMLLLAIGSAWHLLSVANVARTLDWPDDAATPAVIEAMVESAGGRQPATVRLGVDPIYYPVARYYAARLAGGPTSYEVQVVPGEGPAPEFIYTARPFEPSAVTLVRGFAESSATLWRTRSPEP